MVLRIADRWWAGALLVAWSASCTVPALAAEMLRVELPTESGAVVSLGRALSGLEEPTAETLAADVRPYGMGSVVDALRHATRDDPEEFSLALPVATALLMGRLGPVDTEHFTAYLPSIQSFQTSATNLVVAIELATLLSDHQVDAGWAPVLIAQWPQILALADHQYYSLSQDPLPSDLPEHLTELIQRGQARAPDHRAIEALLAAVTVPARARADVEAALKDFANRTTVRRVTRRAEQHLNAETGAEVAWHHDRVPGRPAGHQEGGAIYLPLTTLGNRVAALRQYGALSSDIEAAWGQLNALVRAAELVPDVHLQGDDPHLPSESTDRWVHWLYLRAHAILPSLERQLIEAEIAAFFNGRLPVARLPHQTQQVLVTRMMEALDVTAAELRPAHFFQTLGAFNHRSLGGLLWEWQESDESGRVPEPLEATVDRIRTEVLGLGGLEEWPAPEPAPVPVPPQAHGLIDY